MFVLQNMGIGEISIEGLRVSRYQHKKKTAQVDLALFATEDGDGLEIEINYGASLFKRSTIERLGRHYINLLKGVAANSGLKIHEMIMLDAEECRQLLVDFNNTAGDYPQEKTLHQVFQEQTARTPGNIAAVFEDAALTYQELNRRANRLAIILREKGVKADRHRGNYVKALAGDRSPASWAF